MNKEEYREIEAGLIQMREVTPRIWWNLYQGSLEARFDERQAMCLVQTFILAQNPNGSRPNTGSGPVSDKPQE